MNLQLNDAEVFLLKQVLSDKLKKLEMTHEGIKSQAVLSMVVTKEVRLKDVLGKLSKRGLI
jgi:hypothetical protein